MFRVLLCWLAAVPAAAVLLSQAPAVPSAYSRLQGVQVARASDSRSVELTSLWRKDVAFGLGGERAAVVFLRHFG